MKLTATLAAIAALPSAASFAPVARRHTYSPSSALSYARGDESEPDSSLAHQEPPSYLQPTHTPFLARIETGDWKEWQYSFGRNGLTDFLPQFAPHISCLSIGLDSGHDPARAISDSFEDANMQVPWISGEDSQAKTSIANVPLSPSSEANDHQLEQIHANTASYIITSIDNDDDFDCILDSGVMNSVVNSIPSEVTWHSRSAPTALVDLVKLMSEANQAIREFGIYVAMTETSIPEHTRGYLDAMGEVMGMQWKYDLDGVSSEGKYFVNVARKYFTGPVNMDPSSLAGNGGHLLRP